MSDYEHLMIDILNRVSDTLRMLEDQAHELRAMRQMIEERLIEQPKPKVVRMPWYTKKESEK